MKIAIIGAGINGLYLAWKLSRAGHKVTVFEKKNTIGKESCSGLFSERILEFIPQSRKLIQNEINSVFINFPKRTLKIRFRKKFFVMDHFKLDNLVADFAKKAGARIILGHPIEGFDPIRNLISNGANRVIGCDGADSAIRKSLKLAEPSYRFGIQGFLPLENRSDYVETWPVAKGFIWKIPRGKEVEYGIIADPRQAKNMLSDFLAEKRISLGRTKAAVIPQGFSVPQNDKITLCGDAAGLTKPWSGGGVIWGLMADDILLKNFPDFIKYRNAMKKIFLPRIIFSKIATRMVYSAGFRFPWIMPKNVKIDGDFLI